MTPSEPLKSKKYITFLKYSFVAVILCVITLPYWLFHMNPTWARYLNMVSFKDMETLNQEFHALNQECMGLQTDIHLLKNDYLTLKENFNTKIRTLEETCHKDGTPSSVHDKQPMNRLVTYLLLKDYIRTGQPYHHLMDPVKQAFSHNSQAMEALEILDKRSKTGIISLKLCQRIVREKYEDPKEKDYSLDSFVHMIKNWVKIEKNEVVFSNKTQDSINTFDEKLDFLLKHKPHDTSLGFLKDFKDCYQALKIIENSLIQDIY